MHNPDWQRRSVLFLITTITIISSSFLSLVPSQKDIPLVIAASAASKYNVPIIKGIHLPNGRSSWVINGSTTVCPTSGACEILDDLPSFGSVVVLASDLNNTIEPFTTGRYGSWGPHISDVMATLVANGVRVIVRTDTTTCPLTGSYTNEPGIPLACVNGSPTDAANQVVSLTDLYPWIQDIEVNNEPNNEWPAACTNCSYVINGNTRTFSWSYSTVTNNDGSLSYLRDDQGLYDAISAYYADAWYTINFYKTTHPGLSKVRIWSPPMAQRFEHLRDGNSFYAHLEAMMQLYTDPTNPYTYLIAYHTYPSPNGGGLSNRMWDALNTNSGTANPNSFTQNIRNWLNNTSIPTSSNPRARSIITELGWDTGQMAHCGLTQDSTWWGSLSSFPPAYRNQAHSDCPAINGVNHTFFSDLQYFFQTQTHNAEIVSVWMMRSPSYFDSSAGLDINNGRRNWFNSYLNYNKPSDIFGELRFTFANATTSNQLQVFFKTSTSDFYSEDKSVLVTTIPNDGNWREVTINLSQNSAFMGRITGIRIDPTNISGWYGADDVFIEDKRGNIIKAWYFDNQTTMTNPFFGWTIDNTDQLWTDQNRWGGHAVNGDPHFETNTSFLSGR